MARPRTEAAEYKGLMIRLPEPTLEACKAMAKKERRSLNAQLLCVIDEWLEETREKQNHELASSRDN